MTELRKRGLGVLFAALLLLFAAFGAAACDRANGGPAENPMEQIAGDYYAESAKVDLNGYGQVELNAGKNFLLWNFTKDLVVLTMEKDGSMTFRCNIFDILKFDLSGSWKVSGEEGTRVEFSVEGEEETLVTKYEDERIVLRLDGNEFSMKK